MPGQKDVIPTFGQRCRRIILEVFYDLKDESLESALRRFKEMCKKEGIADAIMRKAYYQKAGGKQKRRTR